MNNLNRAIKYFPPAVGAALCALEDEALSSAEEIRVRLGNRIAVSCGEKTVTLDMTADRRMMLALIDALTEHSPCVYFSQMQNGFFTIEGGVRVGVAGQCVSKEGRCEGFKHVSGLNIRFPREMTGISEPILHYLLQDGRPLSALVASPPQTGKTTLVRDIARALSKRGLKVCIVDERSEIAALSLGSPQYDVGENTDVIDGLNKSAAMQNAVRSLSPDVILTDELGGIEDYDAVKSCMNCGVAVVATAHAASIKDASRGVKFDRYFELSRRLGLITVEHIFATGMVSLADSAVKL